MANRTISEMVIIKLKEHLDKLFPGTNVYSWQKLQGLTEPCFILKIRKAEAIKLLKPQYWYKVYVAINYLPELENAEHLEAVKEELLFTFDEVPFINNTHLRFENLNCEIYDGTLSFTGMAQILVEKEYELGPFMESIEEKTYTDPDVYENEIKPQKDTNMWESKDNRKETDFKMWQSEDEKRKELEEISTSDSPKAYMAGLKKRQEERKENGGGIVWLPR